MRSGKYVVHVQSAPPDTKLAKAAAVVGSCGAIVGLFAVGFVLVLWAAFTLYETVRFIW